MPRVNGEGQKSNITRSLNCPPKMSLMFCTYTSNMTGYYFPLIGNKFPKGFKFFIIYFLIRIFTENTYPFDVEKCHYYSFSLIVLDSFAFSWLDSNTVSSVGLSSTDLLSFVVSDPATTSTCSSSSAKTRSLP